MKAADADAIAQFVALGGKIRKLEDPVAVTDQQVLAYLAKCGLKVKCVPGEAKPYACIARRFSMDGLVRLANTYRAGENLPPMMLKLSPVLGFGNMVPDEPYKPV